MLPQKDFHHKKAPLPSNGDVLYARSIQGMLAPTDEELNELFPDLAVYDKPFGYLSGDFLFARKKMDLTFLAVCDCTGHGISAALMTVLAREKLAHAFDKSIGPAHLLTRLDEKFRRSILRGDKGRLMRAGAGMDLAVVAFNHDRKSLRFAGARRPLWIVRDGALLEYKGTPRSIGGNYWRDDVFVETTIPVKPHDLVYIFTDGLADQFGGLKDKKLMTSGLRKLILEASKLPIKDQASFISDRMKHWQSNYDPTDDQMLAVFKI